MLLLLMQRDKGAGEDSWPVAGGDEEPAAAEPSQVCCGIAATVYCGDVICV